MVCWHKHVIKIQKQPVKIFPEKSWVIFEKNLFKKPTRFRSECAMEKICWYNYMAKFIQEWSKKNITDPITSRKSSTICRTLLGPFLVNLSHILTRLKPHILGNIIFYFVLIQNTTFDGHILNPFQICFVLLKSIHSKLFYRMTVVNDFVKLKRKHLWWRLFSKSWKLN